MRKALRVAALAAIALTAGSCQFSQTRISGLEPTPEERVLYRSELDKAWAQVNTGAFQEGLNAFEKFRSVHPQTIFDAEALLGEAQAWEGLNEWSKAAKIDRQIVGERLASQPEVAVLAMYDLAGVSEALGDESQMLASLQDAESRGQFLPAEIRLAALPARLAVAYTKVSQPFEAKKARAAAEAGIAQLKAQNLPPGKWAELYFVMGTVSTNQLAVENFQGHLDSFAGAQTFLLKAIETGVRPWSSRALQALQEHYRDFWNLAMSPPVSPGMEAGARDRMRGELQSRWLGEIGKLTLLLKQNYKPEELAVSEDEKKLRSFIDNLSAQAEQRQLEAAAVLPLTPEAKKRQSLRKEGVIRSEPLFPNEKREMRKAQPAKSLPAKAQPQPKEDPNLKGEGH